MLNKSLPLLVTICAVTVGCTHKTTLSVTGGQDNVTSVTERKNQGRGSFTEATIDGKNNKTINAGSGFVLQNQQNATTYFTAAGEAVNNVINIGLGTNDTLSGVFLTSDKPNMLVIDTPSGAVGNRVNAKNRNTTTLNVDGRVKSLSNGDDMRIRATSDYNRAQDLTTSYIGIHARYKPIVTLSMSRDTVRQSQVRDGVLWANWTSKHAEYVTVYQKEGDCSGDITQYKHPASQHPLLNKVGLRDDNRTDPLIQPGKYYNLSFALGRNRTPGKREVVIVARGYGHQGYITGQKTKYGYAVPSETTVARACYTVLP